MMMTEIPEVCPNLFTTINEDETKIETETQTEIIKTLDIHVITEPVIVAESPIIDVEVATTVPVTTTTPPPTPSVITTTTTSTPSFFGDHLLKSVTCKSEKLNLTFNIHVENESLTTSQKCFIMSIHEVTRDYTRYQEFINCQQMADVRSRTVWIHVDLPGLESDATDLKIKKYPSMGEIAEELVCVVDHLKVPQVICIGDGRGANVAAYFALKHPNRCLGLVLIEPASFTPGFMDTLRYSMNSVMPMSKTQSSSDKSNFIMKRLEKRGSTDSENEALQQSLNKIYLENHNVYNLALFEESFYNRQTLNDSLKDLKVDVMLAVGQKSTLANDAKKFYKSLQEVRRKNIKQMVNSPFVQLDGVSDVLEEAPERLACTFQYFLQGIGLLSAIPMRNILRSMSLSSSSSSPSNSTGYGRSDSIESSEPQNSQSSHSESHSHSASSNLSLNQ